MCDLAQSVYGSSGKSLFLEGGPQIKDEDIAIYDQSLKSKPQTEVSCVIYLIHKVVFVVKEISSKQVSWYQPILGWRLVSIKFAYKQIPLKIQSQT